MESAKDGGGPQERPVAAATNVEAPLVRKTLLELARGECELVIHIGAKAESCMHPNARITTSVRRIMGLLEMGAMASTEYYSSIRTLEY